jgi:hypothetical protein
MQLELLTLPEHSSSPTALVVFVLSFLCSVLNFIVFPFVLFFWRGGGPCNQLLLFSSKFTEYSSLKWIRWLLGDGQIKHNNSTYSNTTAHPQKRAQPGAPWTEHDMLFLREIQLSNG